MLNAIKITIFKFLYAYYTSYRFSDMQQLAPMYANFEWTNIVNSIMTIRHVFKRKGHTLIVKYMKTVIVAW